MANSIFDLDKTHDVKIFEAAAAKDWQALIDTDMAKQYKRLSDDYTVADKQKNKIAKKLFNKEKFSQLSLEQQWQIVAEADILGSISGGICGFGHETQVYLEDWFREAFANMYLACRYDWTEFKTTFPQMWEYMEDLIK